MVSLLQPHILQSPSIANGWRGKRKKESVDSKKEKEIFNGSKRSKAIDIQKVIEIATVFLPTEISPRKHGNEPTFALSHQSNTQESMLKHSKAKRRLVFDASMATFKTSSLLIMANVPQLDDLLKETDTCAKETSHAQVPHAEGSSSLTVRNESNFVFREPTRWFHFSRDETGEIRLLLPADVREKVDVIYLIQKVEKAADGSLKVLKTRVGKTETAVILRIRSHIQRFKKPAGTSEFVRDMQEDPASMRFAVLYEVGLEESSAACEKLAIKYLKDNNLPCYNKDKGGGGGSSRRREIPAPYSLLLSPLKDSNEKDKYYPITVDRKGRIRPAVSPGFYTKFKQIKNEKKPHQSILYDFIHHEKGCHYIGSSVDYKRIWSHCYAAEIGYCKNRKKYNPYKKISGTFRRALARSPMKFSVRLLPMRFKRLEELSPESQSKAITVYSIGAAERLAIQTLDCLVPRGLNERSGGGGPIPNQKI